MVLVLRHREVRRLFVRWLVDGTLASCPSYVAHDWFIHGTSCRTAGCPSQCLARHHRSQVGNKWAAISKHLPQRSDNDLKNHVSHAVDIMPSCPVLS